MWAANLSAMHCCLLSQPALQIGKPCFQRLRLSKFCAEFEYGSRVSEAHGGRPSGRE